jgi:D-glycero-alpha-D-manno-heptose-7-phosphate kinase
VEVERLGMESGVQDQLCAALGGVNFIEIDSYPRASVSQLRLSERTWAELDQRVVLVSLGRAHVSSDVHAEVIAALAGQRGTVDASLAVLRRAATDARDALMADNLVGLGQAMQANTEAQRRLHHALVSEAAESVIDIAVASGALGWKVNGAGGEGGSITVLCGPDAASRRHLSASLPRADPMFHIIPTSLSRHGVRVSRS